MPVRRIVRRERPTEFAQPHSLAEFRVLGDVDRIVVVDELEPEALGVDGERGCDERNAQEQIASRGGGARFGAHGLVSPTGSRRP